jgi:hypothetical protein
MIRRLIRRFGWLMILQTAWRNRGTVLRTIDAARHLPARIRTNRTQDTVTELRAIVRLATHAQLATRVDIRLASIGDGCVVLDGPSGDPDVEQARRSLLGVAGVVDVRTAAHDAAVSPRNAAGTAEPALAASQP